MVKVLGGLRRRSESELHAEGTTVGALLRNARLPADVLFQEGALNPGVEVLVNGRNIAFLDGLDTRVEEDARVTVFLHGARGYPGG